MDKKDKHILKKEQRIGAVVLLAILVIIMLIVNIIAKKKGYNTEGKQREKVTIRLHDFDPNTADSTELLELGLKPWQIGNINKYRQKGGKYKKKDDFAKLYGMSEEQFNTLKPYIQIDTMPFYQERIKRERQYAMYRDSLDKIWQLRRDSSHQAYLDRKDSIKRYWDSVHISDSIQWAATKKVKKDTLLNLNTADTAELQLIRGIGRYKAVKIVQYRKFLGGYVDAKQLEEIEEKWPTASGLDTLEKYFFIDEKDSIRKIAINMTKAENIRHPYLSFTKAKNIYEYRRSHGSYKSAKDLLKVEGIEEKDVERIAPYLDFKIEKKK